MRAVVLGVLTATGLVVAIAANSPRSEVFAQDVQQRVGSGQLIALSSNEAGVQKVILVDPRTRVMGVYFIDQSGQITLQSVRNVHWDLLMDEYNGASPSPREIRSLLNKR